jgi:hypothetical protein
MEAMAIPGVMAIPEAMAMAATAITGGAGIMEGADITGMGITEGAGGGALPGVTRSGVTRTMHTLIMVIRTMQVIIIVNPMLFTSVR